MSVSKWRYTEECNGRPCPGDCDHCSFEPTDLISRADAIEAVWRAITSDELVQGSVEEEILKLPSADAVQGEWIEVEDDYDNIYWECSNCEDAFVLEVGTPKDNNYNFCPSCGARMKGGAE